MAEGVNTGGFVPTQPAIVDTSAAFTRLLNVAQRQQERDTAIQLAEQQRRQKQIEAQLDIINGFDSSKMVADDRMMFNDYVNKLRMDFVEGRITDPMEFRGRVARTRQYYNQFVQYAQDPETLAAKDNYMKISYYPSELNKANEDLGAGVEYLAGVDQYNERSDRFEHPLGGNPYQITDSGEIVVTTPGGLVPVEGLPRQGSQLFIPEIDYTGEGLTIDSMADLVEVRTSIGRAADIGKYANQSFEGVLLGSQNGRASMIGSYTDEMGGFAGFDDVVEAHITGGRSAVETLIASQERNRATQMRNKYDEFLTYSQDEWRKSVLARRPKKTGGTTQGNLDRQNFLSNYGFSSMQNRVYSAVRGVDMKNVMVRNPETQEYYPMNLLSIGVDNNGLVFAEAVPSDGGVSELVNLSSYPENYQMVNQMLLDDKKVGLEELVNMHKGKVPTPQGMQTAPVETEQPERQYPLLSAAPGEQMPATTTPYVEELADTVRIQSTVTPAETGFEVTASPGQSPGRYGAQIKTQENRVQAIENPESLSLRVREDYNISPFLNRTQEDIVFGDNLRDILNDPVFQRALVQAGYVDFRGLVGYFSDEERNKAMLSALESMGNDERAVYVKEFIQANKERF